jgi:hypothetical protein
VSFDPQAEVNRYRPEERVRAETDDETERSPTPRKGGGKLTRDMKRRLWFQRYQERGKGSKGKGDQKGRGKGKSGGKRG